LPTGNNPPVPGTPPYSTVILWACEGPTGPAGATGPAGPQGIPGLDGTSASISFEIATIASTGSVSVVFANAQVETSVINCYTSPSASSTSNAWLAVADGDDGGSYCGAGNLSGGNLGIALLRGIPGWFFLATLVRVP